MTPESKSPALGVALPENENAKDANRASSASSPCSPRSALSRRQYSPPRVTCLGSVRDLTLGSPTGLLMDLIPGGKRTM